MEAELIAMIEGVKEAMWIASIVEECQGERPTIEVYCDNMAAISVTKESKGISKAKHIDIKYHFLKDLVESKTISIHYVESRNNVADLFTKALAKEKFNNFKQALGLITCPSSGSVGYCDVQNGKV